MDRTIRDELDQLLEARGVQKRDFLKAKRFELAVRGGLWGGDLTSSSWTAGGQLTFFFSEDLGLSLGFEATPIALDLDNPLAEFFGDDRFEAGMGYLPSATLSWSPVHAKFKMGGGIVHGDLLVTLGAGKLFHDSVQGLAAIGGVGFDLFVSKYVTLRFDARDVMIVQEAAAETRYAHNLIATAGFGLWIPTGL